MTRPDRPGAILRRQRHALAAALADRLFAARPALTRRDEPEDREQHLQDASDHLAHLADAMDAGDAGLFADYVGWARVKRGTPADDLTQFLEVTRALVGEALPDPPATLAADYVGVALTRLPSMPIDLPSRLPDLGPHAELAKAYLHALLDGDRHRAGQMILDAVERGAPVREIYLHVFQPSQYEVGRLWQMDQISVAQEHYCTAATQLIMSRLYPRIFASRKGAGTLVATCVAGDLHEIGARMVADFFEMEGWDTFYLGANMPPDAVIETVVERRARVLAISATISGHLEAVRELIAGLRTEPRCAGVKALVGGYPFLVSPGLWQNVGADGWAANAQDAIDLAHRLTAA